MNNVLNFLNRNTTVFLATSDNGEARVRPFQFQFEHNGRLWFCTSRQKEVFAQLQRSPLVELSGMAPDMTTLRLKGSVNLDDDMSIKHRIIETNALVRSIYRTAEYPDFTVFSIDHGSAFIFDFSGNPPVSCIF